MLSKAEALAILKKEIGYSRPVPTYLFCNDAAHARKVIDAGLEEKGLLLVQRTRKFGDVGSPIIQLTAKAQPFVLEASEKEKANIQKLKVAEEDVSQVTRIQTGEDGKSAVVEYTVTFQNVTDFVVLKDQDFNKQETKRVEFALYDDEWRLQRSR